MIPFQEFQYNPSCPGRIVCVDAHGGRGTQQKTLAKALSIGDLGISAMPLAIIADDRQDVSCLDAPIQYCQLSECWKI